jgi:hypothetical protein
MNVKVFCFLAEESVFDMMVYKMFSFFNCKVLLVKTYISGEHDTCVLMFFVILLVLSRRYLRNYGYACLSKFLCSKDTCRFVILPVLGHLSCPCVYLYIKGYLIGLYSNYYAAHGIVVKALRYKPAGRGFDSPWCHWNFSVT